MKLLVKEDLVANQTGTAKIIPEESDDLWLLYNIISQNDVVSAETTRKVHLESSNKSTTASRVKLTLHLKVTCRDFHKDSSTLRIQGRSLDANPYVPQGSFHTFTLELNKPFEIRKKVWDCDAVEALRESAEKVSCAEGDLVVVVMQQKHAEIYLLGKGVTTLCSKIEGSSLTSGRKASFKGPGNAFFREVFGSITKHVDFKLVKSVVIASDGSTKEEFRRFLLLEAKRLRMKSIEENKSRIVVVGLECNNNKGNDHLKEVLGDSTVMNSIKDSKVGIEIRAMRELWDMVCNNSDRACYGPKSVESAEKMKAIETLLINDDVYRSNEIGTRKKYENLVKSVKESGGKVLVYSSMHVLAQQLQQLTGVAAILRFPLPDLEEMDV
ncbi:hypothetical protein TanjilG_20467 [Lupinus angustifolius]|uniref:Protein pelota homolog n=1 Tax=Lupinus angustifolius TaxID=3871 RepID=A0A1J7HES1_LUPAN|nr:PREDICTED: protein PELOTA 1-like [Lupinus angustifolius]OIW11318.1 hypothetical protein TanjilG_20467 [Lupinus angustifolius]